MTYETNRLITHFIWAGVVAIALVLGIPLLKSCSSEINAQSVHREALNHGATQQEAAEAARVILQEKDPRP